MKNNLTKIYDFLFPPNDRQIYQVAFAFVRTLYTLTLLSWLALGVPLILFLYSDMMRSVFSLDSCTISISLLFVLALFSVVTHFFALRNTLSRFHLSKKKNIFGEDILTESQRVSVPNSLLPPKVRPVRVDETIDFMITFNRSRVSLFGPPSGAFFLVLLPFFLFFTRNMDAASTVGYFYFMMYVCLFVAWIFAWSIGTVIAAKEAFVLEDMLE